MSITLLTAVPGGGKTSYAVWEVIKKAHEEGKVIYTVGIPKLTIPTIELSYDQVRAWYKNDIDVKSGLPVLQNVEHGSIIVIDEVQKLWPAVGTKITDDIKELSVHRHYGLSFFVLTQSPNLIHRNVLALVDRHLHIGVKWSGRKIYEWAEYCRSPSAESAKNSAIVFNYTLPKESFDLYHSATEHIKPKKRAPMAFFVFVIALLSTAAFGAYAFNRVMNKTEATTTDIQSDAVEMDETTLNKPEKTLSPVQPASVYVAPIETFNTQILTTSIDWSTVSACLSNASGECGCYGLSAQRLIVPKESCEAAVKYGWNKTKQS